MCCESVPTKRSLREGAGVTAAQNATPRRMQSIAGARKQVGTHNCIDVGCWMVGRQGRQGRPPLIPPLQFSLSP
jgi:hypothetical protein